MDAMRQALDAIDWDAPRDVVCRMLGAYDVGLMVTSGTRRDEIDAARRFDTNLRVDRSEQQSK